MLECPHGFVIYCRFDNVVSRCVEHFKMSSELAGLSLMVTFCGLGSFIESVVTGELALFVDIYSYFLHFRLRIK